MLFNIELSDSNRGILKIVPSRIDASAEENEKINEKNNEEAKGKRSANTKRRIRFFLRINFFLSQF